jgi:hypothetical protein
MEVLDLIQIKVVTVAVQYVYCLLEYETTEFATQAPKFQSNPMPLSSQ